MKNFTIIWVLSLSVLLLAGCTTTNDNSVSCTDEQKSAEVCTMDYTPVCGDDWLTYGNACWAYSSQNIQSYVAGECAVETCGETEEVCDIPEPTQG